MPENIIHNLNVILKRIENAFLEVVEEDSAYLGFIQEKELMAKSLVISQSVFEQHEEMTANQKETHQKFYDNINYVYENILSVLEGEVA